MEAELWYEVTRKAGRWFWFGVGFQLWSNVVKIEFIPSLSSPPPPALLTFRCSLLVILDCSSLRQRVISRVPPQVKIIIRLYVLIVGN